MLTNYKIKYKFFIILIDSMIQRSEMQELVSSYDSNNLKVAVLCSHSALETAAAAKSAGFKTIGITTKGRDKTYAVYNRKLFDKLLYVDEFKDSATKIDDKIQNEIRESNGILIPNRSLSSYCGYDYLENELEIPTFGGRYAQRMENRSAKNNQYDVLKRAGIEFPKRFKAPEEIDRLAVVKIQQKDNKLERAFFYPSTSQEFYQMADERIKKGIIDENDLKTSVIEEYLVGPKINANFHSYALHESLPKYFPTKIDLVGFGIRRQTNSSGLVEIPASEQEKVEGKIKITNQEISHQGATVRESFHESFYNLGENFVKAVNELYPNEMIGSFGLQGAMVADQATLKPKFVVFDVSPRIPGDPAIGPSSPLMRNLTIKYEELQRHLRRSTLMPWIFSFGSKNRYKAKQIEDPLDLTMLEIASAAKYNRLGEIVT